VDIVQGAYCFDPPGAGFGGSSAPDGLAAVHVLPRGGLGRRRSTRPRV